MENFGKIIGKILGSRTNKEKYYLAYLQTNWNKIVGNSVAKKSIPLKVENNILFLKVASSAWAHNLLTIKDEIIEKIYKKEYKINNIKFITDANIEVIEDMEQKEEKIIFPYLTDEEKDEVLNNLDNINDKILYNKLIRILNKDKRRKKYLINKNFNTCELCNVPLTIENEKLCIECKKIENEKNKYELFKLFNDIPWLTYDIAKEYLSISLYEFNSIKNECVELFLKRAVSKNASKSDINRFVMLKTCTKIENLSQDLIDKIMNNMPNNTKNKYKRYL